MAYRWQNATFDELDNTELYAVLRLRQEVFAVEQRSIYLDLDGKDLDAHHMLCWEDGELVAYQRLLKPGSSFQESAMGRIVVCPSARGRNLGRELVRRGMEFNLQQWPDHDIRIGAQSYLQDFYQELGFSVASDEYGEDGIPHVQMLYRRPRGSSE